MLYSFSEISRDPQAQERTDLRINLCMVEVSGDFAHHNKGVGDAMPKLDPTVWMRSFILSDRKLVEA